MQATAQSPSSSLKIALFCNLEGVRIDLTNSSNERVNLIDAGKISLGNQVS